MRNVIFNFLFFVYHISSFAGTTQSTLPKPAEPAPVAKKEVAQIALNKFPKVIITLINQYARNTQKDLSEPIGTYSGHNILFFGANEHSGQVTCMAQLSNGNIVSGARASSTIKEWNPRTMRLVRKHHFTDLIGGFCAGDVDSLTALPEGGFISCTHNSCYLLGSPVMYRWPAAYYQHVSSNQSWFHPMSSICRLILLSNNQALGFGAGCLTHVVLEPDKKVPRKTMLSSITRIFPEQPKDRGNGVEWYAAAPAILLPNGNLIATAHNEIKEWDGVNRTKNAIFIYKSGSNDKSRAEHLAVLASGRFISATSDEITQWIPQCARPVKKYATPSAVVCLAALSNGNFLSAHADNTINQWNPDSDTPVTTYAKHTERINCLTVLPDDTFLSGSNDQNIHKWQSDVRNNLEIAMDSLNPNKKKRLALRDLYVTLLRWEKLVSLKHFKHDLDANLKVLEPLLTGNEKARLEPFKKDLKDYDSGTYWDACARLLFLVKEFIENSAKK